MAGGGPGGLIAPNTIVGLTGGFVGATGATGPTLATPNIIVWLVAAFDEGVEATGAAGPTLATPNIIVWLVGAFARGAGVGTVFTPPPIFVR